jgi:hypothetical protein
LKLAIEQIVADPNSKTFVNTLRGTYCHKLLIKAKIVQANIQRDRFWDTCANFVHMVESILMALKAFNGTHWRRHGSHENVGTTCFIIFHLATKNFTSPILWRPKTFCHHSCGYQKLSITNLVVTEFILVNTPKGASLSVRFLFSLSILTNTINVLGWMST